MKVKLGEPYPNQEPQGFIELSRLTLFQCATLSQRGIVSVKVVQSAELSKIHVEMYQHPSYKANQI